MRPLPLVCSLLLAAPALAKDDAGGIPLEIQVLDIASEAPITIAKVRNVREKELHPVNTENGV